MYKLTIKARPTPKERPKVAGNRAYTPTRTKNFEQKIAAEFRNAYPNAIPIEKPISMAVSFIFKPADSWSKSKKINALAGGLFPTDRQKGDYDNLAKIITDALNGLAFVDDSQIVDAYIQKRYGTEDAIILYLMEVDA